MALKFPNKDPEEVLDYPIQFDDWLVTGCDLNNGSPGFPTVDIESQTPGNSASPLTPLSIDNIFVSGKAVVVWLSGGDAGETYTLKVTAQDNATPVRTVVRRVKITIKEK